MDCEIFRQFAVNVFVAFKKFSLFRKSENLKKWGWFPHSQLWRSEMKLHMVIFSNTFQVLRWFRSRWGVYFEREGLGTLIGISWGSWIWTILFFITVWKDISENIHYLKERMNHEVVFHIRKGYEFNQNLVGTYTTDFCGHKNCECVSPVKSACVQKFCRQKVEMIRWKEWKKWMIEKLFEMWFNQNDLKLRIWKIIFFIFFILVNVTLIQNETHETSVSEICFDDSNNKHVLKVLVQNAISAVKQCSGKLNLFES